MCPLQFLLWLFWSNIFFHKKILVSAVGEINLGFQTISNLAGKLNISAQTSHSILPLVTEPMEANCLFKTYLFVSLLLQAKCYKRIYFRSGKCWTNSCNLTQFRLFTKLCCWVNWIDRVIIISHMRKTWIQRERKTWVK